MADMDENLINNNVSNFEKCAQKINKLVFNDSESFYINLGIILDELNELDFSGHAGSVATEEASGSLLLRLCYLIPVKQEEIVSKLCQLINNLLSRQRLVLVNEAETIVDYLVKSLKTSNALTHSDILRALSTVLYENGCKASKHHQDLLSSDGLLSTAVKSDDQSIRLAAIHCVDNLLFRCNHSCVYLATDLQHNAINIMLWVLQNPKNPEHDQMLFLMQLVAALRGIKRAVIATRSCFPDFLGPILASIKVYMLSGLPGVPTTVLYTLNPSTALENISPAPKQQTIRPKESNIAQVRPGGKKTRRRKGPKARTREDGEAAATFGDEEVEKNSPGLAADDDAVNKSYRGSEFAWNKFVSSESDFSDTEGTQVNKLRFAQCRVRQYALWCFDALLKVCDRRAMFGYWSSFIPNSPMIGGPSNSSTLFTSIMKDPVPKARTAALIVLSGMVESSKQYLMAAEDSDPHRSTPFTPFSVSLGHMIREIHRCLLLALSSENSPLTITQIIKCLATLIPNVPYHRLRPGLLSRTLKQIKPFLRHRDPNIRVACMTCLGSIVSVQTPLLEVAHLLQSTRPTTRVSETQASDITAGESGYNSHQSAASSDGTTTGSSSAGILTPNLSSGSQTPCLNEQAAQSQCAECSWLVKFCVRNLSPSLIGSSSSSNAEGPLQGLDVRSEYVAWSTEDDTGISLSGASTCLSPSKDAPPITMAWGVDSDRKSTDHVQPLPVRLESLQLLGHITKGYFPVVRNSLQLMRDLIIFCLHDPDLSVQLHGAKLLEEIGAATLHQHEQATIAGKTDADNNDEMVEFWLPLLSGPLPTTLQNPASHSVRATACDCFSSIGGGVFEKMPVDKRIMCLTLLLGSTSDDHQLVRGSAIRALGVYSLYPCLREDVSFIADVANVLIESLKEENMYVRAKAAWSLGTLSDALVFNKTDGDASFMEDFSDMLLLKLFEAGILSSQDNDKVRSNSVRALGNFLRYLPARSYKSGRFHSIVDVSVKTLAKSITTGAVKVRWNACYGVGCMFRNDLLPLGSAEWTTSLLKALAQVVKECKNFKVRINAAASLSIPTERSCYGSNKLFFEVWSGLFQALRSSEDASDFAEFKYRENLIEQICCSLVHLSTLLTGDDVGEELGNLLQNTLPSLPQHIAKYRHLMTEKQQTNKCEEINQAQHHLSLLSKDQNLSEDQKSIVQTLHQAFLPEDETTKERITFLQTYD